MRIMQVKTTPKRPRSMREIGTEAFARRAVVRRVLESLELRADEPGTGEDEPEREHQGDHPDDPVCRDQRVDRLDPAEDGASQDPEQDHEQRDDRKDAGGDLERAASS